MRQGESALILKVLTGSRAHHLHTEQSDYDYRGVFVQPTKAILSLLGHPKQTSWVECRVPEEGGRKEDDTAWEIGHFLHLATHSNPSILEVFAAPIMEATEEGKAMQALLPYVWSPSSVRDAFIGYGLNQRKKMLENKDARPNKYAVAYLRTLIQGVGLLEHGTIPIRMDLHPEYQTLLMCKNRMVTLGQVIDKCMVWQRRL